MVHSVGSTIHGPPLTACRSCLLKVLTARASSMVWGSGAGFILSNLGR